MLWIVIGCIAPMVALFFALRMSLSWAGDPSSRRGSGDLRPRSVGRWESVTEEVARRGHRARPRRSDAATRRRHLAAVLPADARR